MNKTEERKRLASLSRRIKGRARLMMPRDKSFDVETYRMQNRDLADAGLDKDALYHHFVTSGRWELRPYAMTRTASDLMSMRWLRGRGVEIGAGSRPINAFGETKVELAEVDHGLAFRGGDVRHWMDVGGAAPEALRAIFDFAVASHVLEHCDSFVRGIVNMLDIVKPDGLIYVVLPDKRYLGDRIFIDDFDLAHHMREFTEPLLYADVHDTAYLPYAQKDGDENEHARLSEHYRADLKAGKISPAHRFMHHKHNYAFGKWLELMTGLRAEFGFFDIEDACFGRDRLDCHFILRKLKNFRPAPPIAA